MSEGSAAAGDGGAQKLTRRRDAVVDTKSEEEARKLKRQKFVRREAKRVSAKAKALEFDADGFAVNEPQLGVGRWRVGAADFAVLREAHETIKSRILDAKGAMGWAGGSDATDSRWRCYGLPRGAEQRLRDGGVNFHSFETRGADGRAQEEQRNWASCCDVEILDELDAALCNVAASAARAVGNAYPPGAGRDDLVALQPNVHAGAAHLPSHFDWPLHDGFGVVIVTISMQRSATVVLNDDQAKEWSFNLDAGEAYALTGKARNVCSHGVLCDPKVVDRESLNLRFGLHTQPRAEREIYAAWSQEPWCTAQGPVVFE